MHKEGGGMLLQRLSSSERLRSIFACAEIFLRVGYHTALAWVCSKLRLSLISESLINTNKKESSVAGDTICCIYDGCVNLFLSAE